MEIDINDTYNFNELYSKYPCFLPLKDRIKWENSNYSWFFKLRHKKIFCPMIMFIGQTGYGKSTTLNSISGYENFKTSDIESCTKDPSCIIYKISNTYYLGFCDFPGIGESEEMDKSYISSYNKFVDHSICIVYLLSADKRDYKCDIDCLNKIQSHHNKLIIAINNADKIEPINRNSKTISTLQKENLENKRMEISRIFNISMSRVFWYSAKEKYQFDQLMAEICKVSINY